MMEGLRILFIAVLLTIAFVEGTWWWINKDFEWTAKVRDKVKWFWEKTRIFWYTVLATLLLW